MTDYKILYYEIYECPQCPTDSGRYYGKTPVLEMKMNKLIEDLIIKCC